MQTYEHLAEMARICAKNSHIASGKEIAAELWRMATEYRDKAAKLNGGAGPEIGQPRYTDDQRVNSSAADLRPGSSSK